MIHHSRFVSLFDDYVDDRGRDGDGVDEDHDYDDNDDDPAEPNCTTAHDHDDFVTRLSSQFNGGLI